MDLPENLDLQDELARTRREIEKLETEKQLQADEIRALKAETRSYQDELRSLNSKVQSLEEQALQETPAGDIGKEVRLRYLERHRQRMGKGIGNLSKERIKCGDRAAHRGRPVADALLCLTGYRASLQSEGRLTRDFQVPFGRLLEVAKTYSSSIELGAAFRENKTLQQLQDELQSCYDRIVNANPRGRQDSSPQVNH